MEDVQFFPMKTWMRVLYALCIPIAGWLLWGAGIGVSKDHLILKGFGTKRIPWGEIESLTQGSISLLGGAAGALLSSLVIKAPLLLKQRGKFGALSVPVHQTEDPKALLAAITQRLDVA